MTKRQPAASSNPEGEEDHIDWLEIQLKLIKKVGWQNHIQSQM